MDKSAKILDSLHKASERLKEAQSRLLHFEWQASQARQNRLKAQADVEAAETEFRALIEDAVSDFPGAGA